MIIVVFFDGGIFMLKPAYQLLRFSKGERLFVFQKKVVVRYKVLSEIEFYGEAACLIEEHQSRIKWIALSESPHRYVLLIQYSFVSSFFMKTC